MQTKKTLHVDGPRVGINIKKLGGEFDIASGIAWIPARPWSTDAIGAMRTICAELGLNASETDEAFTAVNRICVRGAIMDALE